MPIHDWSRVHFQLFHHFRQEWMVEIARALNRGGLPPGFSALLERGDDEGSRKRPSQIVIRRDLGRMIALIDAPLSEVKSSASALRVLVGSIIQCLEARVHVLLIDLFPPTPNDPFGLHKAVWEKLGHDDFVHSPPKDRTLVSYECGEIYSAYVEPNWCRRHLD
jgi:hypothetical protein